MEVIARFPGNQLEEVVLKRPVVTWKQAFCELNHLRRRGGVRLTRQGSDLCAMPNPISCNHLA